MIRRAGLVLVLAGVAVLGWTAVRLWVAWNDVTRVPFQTAAAREALADPFRTSDGTIEYVEDEIDVAEGRAPVVGGEVATDAEAFARPAATTLDEALDVFLILGSDQRDANGTSRRADVILLFMVPTDGSPPILTSIPRDLYLPNPCSGGMSRVNANLNGCGSYATGPEQVAIAVEDFTGVPIDHFVVFDFEGFTAIVDRVGGVEICVPYPVRDNGVKPTSLSLPAGCTQADGDQALAWVRSRKTEGLINGAWQPIGASDLTRNDRQQDLLVQAMGRLGTFSDISELTALVEELAPLVTIDDGLGVGAAVAFAWDLRGLDADAIRRIRIPVADYVDPSGRWVLVPQATFDDLLVAADPELAAFLVGG